MVRKDGDGWDVAEAKEFYTLAEAARIVRLRTSRAVSRALRLNGLPVNTLGKEHTVRHRDLMRLIEASSVVLPEKEGQ